MKVDRAFVDSKQYDPSEVRVSLDSDRQKKAGRATKNK